MVLEPEAGASIVSTATTQVRVASLMTVVDARGLEMARAQTVTLLNDLRVLAPAALVDAPFVWTPIDDHHVSATFTNAGQTVRAVLWGGWGSADLGRLRSAEQVGHIV